VQADSFSQQQQDSGINLNQFFSSPEAIQVLLLFIFICEATFGENSMSR
jgi:uncharacterized membrane protein YwzB